MILDELTVTFPILKPLSVMALQKSKAEVFKVKELELFKELKETIEYFNSTIKSAINDENLNIVNFVQKLIDLLLVALIKWIKFNSSFVTSDIYLNYEEVRSSIKTFLSEDNIFSILTLIEMILKNLRLFIESLDESKIQMFISQIVSQSDKFLNLVFEFAEAFRPLLNDFIENLIAKSQTQTDPIMKIIMKARIKYLSENVISEIDDFLDEIISQLEVHKVLNDDMKITLLSILFKGILSKRTELFKPIKFNTKLTVLNEEFMSTLESKQMIDKMILYHSVFSFTKVLLLEEICEHGSKLKELSNIILTAFPDCKFIDEFKNLLDFEKKKKTENNILINSFYTPRPDNHLLNSSNKVSKKDFDFHFLVDNLPENSLSFNSTILAARSKKIYWFIKNNDDEK
jgi:hypothetical protein